MNSVVKAYPKLDSKYFGTFIVCTGYILALKSTLFDQNLSLLLKVKVTILDSMFWSL